MKMPREALDRVLVYTQFRQEHVVGPSQPPIPGPRARTMLVFLAGVPGAAVTETPGEVEALLEDVADNSWIDVTEVHQGRARPARYRAGLVAGILSLE